MGRVLLAGLSRNAWSGIATAKFTALTDRTITIPRGCARSLRNAVGRATRPSRTSLRTVVAVAVPVFDSIGRIVSALNSSGHSKKMSKAKPVRERLPMLTEAARDISRELARLPGLALSAQL
jgi:DNA-binding IclR family transcriptional regulator